MSLHARNRHPLEPSTEQVFLLASQHFRVVDRMQKLTQHALTQPALHDFGLLMQAALEDALR